MSPYRSGQVQLTDTVLDKNGAVPDEAHRMGTSRTDRVILERLGQRIAATRHRTGLTQAALAERAGIDPVTLSRWETGARSPSICALVRLADVLGVRPGDLLNYETTTDQGRLDELVAVAGTLSDDQQELATRLLREIGRPSRAG
jgi:transcriptional regulator with XRE-family HTH domain